MNVEYFPKCCLKMFTIDDNTISLKHLWQNLPFLEKVIPPKRIFIEQNYIYINSKEPKLKGSNAEAEAAVAKKTKLSCNFKII